MELLRQRLAPLATQVPAWAVCLPLLARDKKSQGEASTTDTAGTLIHCILPRPGDQAVQRLLPASVWETPLTRLIAMLRLEAARA